MLPYKFKDSCFGDTGMQRVKCSRWDLFGRIVWWLCVASLGFLGGCLYGFHVYESLQIEEIRRLTAQIEYRGGSE